MLIVGGFDGNSLERVEIHDLENASATLNDIPPYPTKNYGMAVGVFQDVVKACGGAANPNTCYDYHPERKIWSESTPMLFGRYHHAASFIEKLWLLSGSSGSTGGHTSTEKWDGSAFAEGTSLQRGMHGHCQLTVNDTHILFVMADGQSNYLLNWTSQEWTELDPMMYLLNNPSCGLINNTRNGVEAVVAGFGISQIFNFVSMIWRIGPNAPYFFGAGYTQLSDTFIVVGGRNLTLHFLDTMYKFDNENYEWISLDHKLQVPSSSLSVVTIPNDFVPSEGELPDLAFNSKSPNYISVNLDLTNCYFFTFLHVGSLFSEIGYITC